MVLPRLLLLLEARVGFDSINLPCVLFFGPIVRIGVVPRAMNLEGFEDRASIAHDVYLDNRLGLVPPSAVTDGALERFVGLVLGTGLDRQP